MVGLCCIHSLVGKGVVRDFVSSMDFFVHMDGKMSVVVMFLESWPSDNQTCHDVGVSHFEIKRMVITSGEND